MSVKAVFLDRDGVINHDDGYTFEIEKLKILPNVGESLARLKRSGFTLVVITNQSGVARGLYNLENVQLFHAALQNALFQYSQVVIDHFYICPHHPEGKIQEYTVSCDCRKPGHLNIERAIRDLNIDRHRSYLIGDRESDLEAGRRAHLKKCYLFSPNEPIDVIAHHIIDTDY